MAFKVFYFFVRFSACMFFFFKQKTSYEMRISDWSSDVCSSDLAVEQRPGELEAVLAAFVEPALSLALDRHGGAAFIRVIARAYAEKNDSLRKFLSDQYGHVPREFAKAIAKCQPDPPKEQIGRESCRERGGQYR